jgi:hypothetical protein
MVNQCQALSTRTNGPRSAIDIERLARRVARVGVKPLGLEIIAGVGRRSLLVKGRPVARELRQRFQ